MKIILRIVALLFGLLPAVCFAAPKAVEPAWSYDDDYTGQEDWGSIKGYELCNDGAAQSPIRISYTKRVLLPQLKFEYKSAEASITADRKTFALDIKNAGYVLVDGLRYVLNRVEFHSPSGHMIGENYAPLEINLIHKNSGGGLLIIAVFANMGAENKALIPMVANSEKKSFSFDPSFLVPKNGGYYSYTGSLPYPPCTEGVRWRVMKSGVSLSKQQLEVITKAVGRNTRLTQPVYMRDILETDGM